MRPIFLEIEQNFYGKVWYFFDEIGNKKPVRAEGPAVVAHQLISGVPFKITQWHEIATGSLVKRDIDRIDNE